MAENKIYPWAQSSDANVFSDAEYAADVEAGGIYVGGVQTGLASSKQANKTWRQATAPGSGLGQFLVDNLSVDVTDADTPATFSSRIANAILKLAQISPFNKSFAAATGGYRKYAIVSDSSGNYWSSTADQNVTVPGSSGANWQSLFDGYATESWANGQFLQLALATPQSVTGPVDFEGDTTYNQTLLVTGNEPTIHFTRSGVTQWDTWVGPDGALFVRKFDKDGNWIEDYSRFKPNGSIEFAKPVTLSGGALVPDITEFTGKDALNAETAEGRYVKSVPATGGTNVRIVDVQEDASGNLIATKSDGTTTSYAPSSYGTFTGGYWIQTGNIRQIWWSQTVKAGDTVPYPLAFASAPRVFAQQNIHKSQAPYWEMGFVCIDNESVTAQNFVLNTTLLYSNTGGTFGPPIDGSSINFYAAGPVS